MRSQDALDSGRTGTAKVLSDRFQELHLQLRVKVRFGLFDQQERKVILLLLQEEEFRGDEE
jgi:hypothetical protein